MKHPMIDDKPGAEAVADADPLAPLQAVLAESERQLQVRIRSGLSRQQFSTAQALQDALRACQEVVQACQTD